MSRDDRSADNVEVLTTWFGAWIKICCWGVRQCFELEKLCQGILQVYSEVSGSDFLPTDTPSAVRSGCVGNDQSVHTITYNNHIIWKVQSGNETTD